MVLCNPDIRADSRHWAALQSDDPRELVVVDQVDAEGRPASVVNRYPTPEVTLLTALRVGRFAPRGSRRRRWLGNLLGRWGKAHAGPLQAMAPGASKSDRTYRLADHWPSAALISMDTGLLSAVGGFDENYFLYLEDVDLAARLAVAAPEAMVKVAATARQSTWSAGRYMMWLRNALVRHQRWHSAVLYAAGQPGARWRLVTAMLRVGSRLTARTTGRPPQRRGTAARQDLRRNQFGQATRAAGQWSRWCTPLDGTRGDPPGCSLARPAGGGGIRPGASGPTSTFCRRRRTVGWT